ncbi:Cof-type HAD-IIB family hydrolase [Paenactinomyces guangxiensis]|uniref:HAD family phosphatase n=1 Tax=Paenactinomyces guangxiensis TaxID=1490290 RepID=A0A7W1WPF3_9BACL|nr:Cof-type HAD-IIB family hydrolase [Paenactinomyces guangxiensis]MBA4493575.1 HAD family phosphatase [Paenactinomyces guangxiensis]MBH8590666.1 HAD family phosphatase [Paenactinomyces guangxiensis]
MSQPHLIALDLDGTLLKDDKTISTRTKQTLKRVTEAGHKVCIATGRPYQLSKKYYEELRLDTPLVNFNGAFVHHPHDPHFGRYHSPLHLPTVKQVIATCEKFKVCHIMVEVLDTVFIRSQDEILEDTFLTTDRTIHKGDLIQILQDEPTSILIKPRDDHYDELFARLQQAHAEVIEQRKWGAPWNIIEIVRSGINKWVGLQKIAAYYGIPHKHIITFGDEDNDTEMIRYAGQGIAMGNAIHSLKQIADSVTTSNEEDGVAVYLEKTLLA